MAEDFVDDEIEEISDFEELPTVYEVWLFGYDEDDKETDYTAQLKNFLDCEEAIKFADEYVLSGALPPENKYVRVEVISRVFDGDIDDMLAIERSRVIVIGE